MSSTDDPQTTPNPDDKEQNHINALFARKLHAIDQSVICLDESVKKMGSTLEDLVRTSTALVDQVFWLTELVKKLSVADDTMRDALGAVRQRLRIVEGHGDECEIDP